MENPFEQINQRLSNIEAFLVRIDKSLSQQATMTTTDKTDTYIDQKRVAELLGVSGVSVWEYERKGFLKSYRIGNLKRFLLSEVMTSPKLIKRTDK